MKRRRDFGDLVTLPIEWVLVGMLVMFYIMSWEQEKIMNEYVDDLYLKLSKEEFIEEYVKARNKQHTLKDYDLYLTQFPHAMQNQNFSKSFHLCHIERHFYIYWIQFALQLIDYMM